MNKSEMKQISLAMMYGDSFVDVNFNSGKARLDTYHSDKQVSYILQKQNWLNNINDVSTVLTEKIDTRLLKSGETRKGWRLQTTFSRYLFSLFVTPDKFKIKQLVKPAALSVLWMDNGTICWDNKNYYSTAYLCTDRWDWEFVKNFLKVFNNEYGWRPTLMHYKCRDKIYPRLRFRKTEMEKLSGIIKSYVLPDLEYKIL